MSGVEREIELTGGNVGRVVRVGDTVRRVTGPWTPAVHALLDHLAATGFTAAPRVLGIDAQGREILTFVEGDCGLIPSAPADAGDLFSDASLVAVARLIRRFHDASASFVPPADARWRTIPGAAAHLATTQQPVIIGHTDLATYNTIYRGGAPVAFIDWDFAAPATRAWDLAFAAWRFVPLMNDDDNASIGWPPPDRSARLRAFADAYGFDDAMGRATFVATVRERQLAGERTIRAWGAAGVPGFDRMLADGHADGVRRDVRFLDAHATEWQAALG